jgi:hypothetical protein
LEDAEVGSPPPGTGWHAVSAGSDQGCALDEKGSVTCWGGAYGQVWPYEDSPTDTTFLSVYAGFQGACGVTTDTTLLCWPGQIEEGTNWGNLDGMAPTTTGWAEVHVGDRAACALSLAGEIECWGQYRKWGLMEIPELPE